MTTNNGLFSRFGLNCAEPINFTFQRWSMPPCRSFPTRKARGSNPFGRTKSSTLWGAAPFALRGFYGAVREGIRTARTPRFASRGAETPRWGVSRARLGESLRAHQKAHCNALFGLMLFGFQNHFSSLSSAASVYCLFAGFSFLSLFMVVRIARWIEVGALFARAAYSIAASDMLCKTCPILH